MHMFTLRPSGVYVVSYKSNNFKTLVAFVIQGHKHLPHHTSRPGPWCDVTGVTYVTSQPTGGVM